MKRAPSLLWRGIELFPRPSLPGTYESADVPISSYLTSNWRVQKIGEGHEEHWHARLRMGTDRYPGKGWTAIEALDSAAAHANEVRALLEKHVPAVKPIRKAVKR